MIRDLARNLGLITAGSFLVAVAVNGILLPHQFLAGGVLGAVLILKYAFSWIPVSAAYFLLNIPIFVAGWRMVGRRFFFYSLAGMGILSLMFQLVQVTVPVKDTFLAALLGGLVMGAGSGIMLRSRGSGGGADVLAVILLNRFSVRVGNTYLTCNVLVMAAAVFTVPLDAVLYTLVYMYVTSRAVELVLTGLSQRKLLIIVSPKWRDISREILHKIRRGVTHIQAQGGFSGQSETMIYTVVTIQDLPRVKNIIRRLDPDAFVVVTNTLEVMGYRIGNQPHW